jgi:hypothetical protein
LDVANAIHTVVEESETRARKADPPEWLDPLASAWAVNAPGIITFNYDLIVERALHGQRVVSTLADLYPVPLVSRWPAGSAGFLSASGPSREPVPELMKLHGSLNWRYGGYTAPVSEELYLVPGHDLWAPESPSGRVVPPRHKNLFDDKIPMIVPPTGVKNAWYGNLAMRALWRRADKTLSGCDRLVVIGYSFPATDQLIRHMVTQSWGPGRDAVVVDRSPAPAAALATLLRQSVDDTYTGDQAVDRFVEMYAR